MKNFDENEINEQSKFTGVRKQHNNKKEEGFQKSKPKSKKPWTKKHEKHVESEEESA